MLLQNVPVERLCEIAEAVAKNAHLEKLHLANTRATDKVANVSVMMLYTAVTTAMFSTCAVYINCFTSAVTVKILNNVTLKLCG